MTVTRRDALKRLGTGAAALTLGGCALRRPRPNVVFILVDDLGWKDLGCYGASLHETPHIDGLAKGGMRFTNAYAASPVCSPTRASILTGRHPARLHITDWIPGDDPRDRPLLGPQDEYEMALDEVTLAEAFKEAGYATGFIGKWHLGDKGHYPQDQGFDLNIAGHHAGHPASYFYPYKNRHGFWDVPDLEDGQDGEYLTDRLTNEAVNYIERQSDKPFLLYLAYYSVHTPIQPRPDLKAEYDDKVSGLDASERDQWREEHDVKTRLSQDHAGYGAMVQCVDNGVGRVVAALKEQGILDNTLLVFMSDNGGLSTTRYGGPASVNPLRAGKGWVYEGGIRVPMIFHWPGHIPAGESHEPVMSTDFYPTLLHLAGLKSRPQQHLDGCNLAWLWDKSSSLNRDFLVWHYPHYHGSGHRPATAIRQGDWKLIYWYENEEVELYNLANDLEEMQNLASSEPERAAAMKQAMMNWLDSVHAQRPIRNRAGREADL